MKPKARRAISPEGCKRSAALCARSNEGVTILAAFLPVSLENAIAGWLAISINATLLTAYGMKHEGDVRQ
ncbi:MAG: hypothetical protein JST63_03080 [Bacteroidetes bacterium]|nr:hypothetical protein [Bacteroidota bacterium]